MIDFGVLPPEVNSARMYSGAGAGPLLSAASAWSELSSALDASVDETRALVAGLETVWQGNASEEMGQKMASHASWLTNTATVAQHTAAQANAAAAAYEEAFAATVNPALIAYNRAELLTLCATNLLGQNTPAIMANEAEYSEMWAQDASAMYGYASSSAQATQLQQFTQPVSASGVPAVPASTTSTTSSIGSILQQLLSQISLDPINDTFSGAMVGANWVAALIQGIPAMLAIANGSNGGSGYNPAVAVPNPAPPVIDFQPDMTAAPGRVIPKPASAAVGAGDRVGGLSTPPSWANAANAVETPAAEFRPFYGAAEGDGIPALAVPYGGRGTGGTEERRQQPKYGQKVQVLP